MQAFSKTLVLLLLAAVVAAPLAAQALQPGAPRHQRPAGCHEDGGNAPAPTPISHSCCEGEHQPAILQQGSTLRSSFQVSAQVESSPDAAVVAAFNPFPSFVVASGGPPVISPLRL